jgi:hypothetical protein
METVETRNFPKFSCINCGIKTNNKKDFANHIMTAKHAKLGNGNTGNTFFPKFRCEKCKKSYASRAGLWKHNKTCNNIIIIDDTIINDNITLKISNIVTKQKEYETDDTITDDTITDDIITGDTITGDTITGDTITGYTITDNIITGETITDDTITDDTITDDTITDDVAFKKLILEVVRSNADMQKQNSDLQKQMLEMCKNTSNTTINSHNRISNNKTFNLHFFLNEQCKDAMNISDFVNSFELQLSDLESVGDLGYVEGMTKIFLDKINSMDIYKRPIHCSDAKREIIYIKDANKWEKELRNNPKLRYAIKTLSFKNMKMANVWSDTYPESKASESRLNDVYMKLVLQSTGGKGEIGDNENKIIRRIAKEIVIDKTTF